MKVLQYSSTENVVLVFYHKERYASARYSIEYLWLECFEEMVMQKQITIILFGYMQVAQVADSKDVQSISKSQFNRESIEEKNSYSYLETM